MRNIKRGNLNFCFTLDNTNYQLNMCKETTTGDTENGQVMTIELNTSNNTTNKKVLMKKIINDGSPPEFQMEGSPGMTEQEQLDFVRNWLTVVHSHVDGIMGVRQSCPCNMPDGVQSFIEIFDHYFKDRVFEDLGLQVMMSPDGVDDARSELQEESMDEDDEE